METNKIKNILNDIEPILNSLLDYFPDPKNVNLAKRSFDNILDLAEQYRDAISQGNIEDIKRTHRSLEHSITALISIIISGISTLDDSLKDSAANLGLRIISVLITKLFNEVIVD